MLLGGLLVAAVIVGLLAMHTLNLHGTPAAHAPAITVSATGTEGAHHSAGGVHESGGSAGDLGSACTDGSAVSLVDTSYQAAAAAWTD